MQGCNIWSAAYLGTYNCKPYLSQTNHLRRYAQQMQKTSERKRETIGKIKTIKRLGNIGKTLTRNKWYV